MAAHQFLPDELMSKFYFRIVLKKKLNLENPRTFNEKMQWLKLYYFPFDKNVIRCTDKYKVRGYMKERGYEDLLVPLIGCWEHAEEIDWELLPKQFVLKCNHGCAYNILCNDKSRLDKRHAIKQLNRWLKEDFGAFNIELHYSQIKPHLILCEEFLGDCIMDYKFFCFNGEPKFVYVSRDLIHDRQAQIGLFYLDGQKMPIKRDDYEDIESVEFPPFLPKCKRLPRNYAENFLL